MRVITIPLSGQRPATLTAHLWEAENEAPARPGVMVIPGGAYHSIAEGEADCVALRYAAAGFQTFVLRYTVTPGAWDDPLQDYELAMEQISRHAQQWQVLPGKVAVVGFSAGGHLAACAATMAKHPPAAAILVYPVIEDSGAQVCFMKNLPRPDLFVTGDTCPCFLVGARDDRTVPPDNLMAFEQALLNAGIPFESHLYAFGGHGFSTGERGTCDHHVPTRLRGCLPMSVEWLHDTLGEWTARGMTAPDPAAQKCGDDAPFLSVTCTLRCVLENHAADGVMAPLYGAMEQKALTLGRDPGQYMTAMDKYSVRELMDVMHFSCGQILETDQRLHTIPNQ